MNLTELKKKSMPQLLEIAESMNLENLARSRKQDVIFSILKAHAKSGEDIYGDGVLEILSDGFGFCGLLTRAISRVQTTSTSHRAKYDDSTFVKVIQLLEKFALQKIANATLRC